MKSTFRILFYAKWEASDEAKMLPIYVRITINGTKARFSLKIRVSEKIWDAKSGRAIGHSHEALQANRYLDSVVTRINSNCFHIFAGCRHILIHCSPSHSHNLPNKNSTTYRTKSPQMPEFCSFFFGD